ncbi:MAG: anti-sigma factor [Gammaproteobacteria bacterium]|nr:anti-sigma factor [Gammaproteobacteria bacterium]MCP5138144.1 anti-sigma factor [Gammaproteobacteria bacterium]
MSDMAQDFKDPGEPDDNELALEYVLGTLDADARERADALRRRDIAFDRRIGFWEHNLAQLYASEPEVRPSPKVRALLLARLFPQAVAGSEGWRRSLFWWRGLALTASVAALALSVVLVGRMVDNTGTTLPQIVQQQQEVFQPAYCAWFKTDEKMVWVLWADPDSGKMRAVVPGQNMAFDTTQHAMELWMLPADGTAPRSLGLMPAMGSAELKMPANLIAEAKGLAISQEPPGGSPTGLPTGPVLYQSPWWPVG